MKAAAAADAIVPSGVTVDAVDYLGPQLSARDTVLWWVADERTYAPWVVADITTAQYVLHRAGSGDKISSKEAPG